MLVTARGWRRTHLVWIGFLGKLVYDEYIFAFDIAFNPLLLIYVGLLSLACWQPSPRSLHTNYPPIPGREPIFLPTSGIYGGQATQTSR
jgi:hypothetical protein